MNTDDALIALRDALKDVPAEWLTGNGPLAVLVQAVSALEDINERIAVLVAERDEARRMLAECYVLSGADPDGDDWRHLWQTAVAEVRQTMEEHRAEVEALVAERDEALAIIRRLTVDPRPMTPAEMAHALTISPASELAGNCCGKVFSRRPLPGGSFIVRRCPLPAGHDGFCAEALGDNGGPNG